MASKPEDYPWSSHNAYFGREDFTWLERDRVLSRFGSIRSEALAHYRDFMKAKNDAMEDWGEIRRASGVGCYGSEEFTRIYAPDELSNRPPKENQISIDKLVEMICDMCSVSIDQLRSTERSQVVVDARAILARSTERLEGLYLGDVSRKLQKNPGTISRLANRAEKDVRLNSIVDDLVKSISKTE